MNRTARWGSVLLGITFSGVIVFACSSSDTSGLSAPPGTSSEAGPPDGESPQGDGAPPEAGMMVGQLDGGPDTSLPSLPTLTNVVATEREDSVGIDFDPVDDAVDYRVYPLPADSDVTVNADKSITIKNGIYHCAGLRQTFDLPNGTTNPIGVVPTDGQAYSNFNPQYSWGAQIPENPTLGYVHVEAGPGLVPVYAVGVHPSSSESGWREARAKIYTTDAAAYGMLVKQGGRDDGAVFFVPSAASSGTATLYHSEDVQNEGYQQYSEYYFGSTDVSMHMDDATKPAPAFQVETAAGAGLVPLMAVLYQDDHPHTELAVGKERFKRASNQGQGPLWHVEWTGITQPTTLVVEALASGCPYQGFLTPTSLKAPPHQPFMTLQEIQAASKTTEVYINGQFDLPGSSWTTIDGMWGTSSDGLALLATPNASPVPLARSFIQVAPDPHDPAAWDWYEGFSSPLPMMTQAADDKSCSCQDGPGTKFPCNSGGGDCGYWTSSRFNYGAYLLDNPSDVAVVSYGTIAGQMWDAFDDWGQDVTSMLRFTVPKTTTVDASTFLHVTWSVNIVTTDRRYPQLIVSDQGSPIEDSFADPNSNTLLIQPIVGPSMRLDIEAFHGLVGGQPWAVNNQAPYHSLIDYDGYDSQNATTSTTAAAQTEPIFEHAGIDRMTKFDAYVSSNRLYVFMDGFPTGCTEYPTDFAMSGNVTVTFGDVLYHEDAPDELVCHVARPFAFNHEHQCTETKRQWDDLGFKAGVTAPAWDETRFPCTPYGTAGN